MNSYALSHLADHVLLKNLASLVAQDRHTTAALLAHLSEVDARKLYLPAAYPSMFHYCVGELRLSEDAAFMRIRAARTAREHPAIYAALADGRLHLSAVVLLAPHLTPANASELLAAAAGKTKAEIETLLAQRFPRPDVPAQLVPLVPADAGSLVPERVADAGPLALGQAKGLAIELVSEPLAPRAKLAPLSAERFALQVTIGKATHDKLRYAQALLGHAAPSGDLAQVLDRVLELAITQLEKRRFAASSQSCPGRKPGKNGKRYIPADVRRRVWQRDHGQCTFVSEQGHRCPARARLEFDHVTPFARAGSTIAENLRLRCRAHNQYAAECAFGAGFMARKRGEARREAERARGRTAAHAAHAAGAAESVSPAQSDVIPWLEALGFRRDEARRAAALCAGRCDAPLEERVRLALRSLAPHAVRRAGLPPAGSPA